MRLYYYCTPSRPYLPTDNISTLWIICCFSQLGQCSPRALLSITFVTSIPGGLWSNLEFAQSCNGTVESIKCENRADECDLITCVGGNLRTSVLKVLFDFFGYKASLLETEYKSCALTIILIRNKSSIRRLFMKPRSTMTSNSHKQ